jgi:ketosteroid isomerase-like protein
MTDDENAIRQVVEAWMAASKRSDLATVLMTDDAIFMVPGQEAFGKEAFAAASKGMGRSGYTLSLLRKEADGRWRLARDANLVTTQS